MIKVNHAISIIILFVGIWGLSFAAEPAKTVVTVNGVSLTEGDLKEEIQKLLPSEASFHSGITPEKMKSIRTKATEALVVSELQYQDATAKGLKLTDKEIEVEIAKIKAKIKGKIDFDKLLENNGFTEKTYTRLLERRILKDRIKNLAVDQKLKITDETIRDYYEKNKSRYAKPMEFRASQILVRIDPSANDAERLKRREKAESILKQLKEGADFGAMALKESEDLSSIKGGDLGTFHLGQTEPAFDEAVQHMKPGEISGLVETIYGLHIIKLVEARESRQMSLDEVKDKIRALITEQEENKLYQQWINDLKNKAKIVYSAEG